MSLGTAFSDSTSSPPNKRKRLGKSSGQLTRYRTGAKGVRIILSSFPEAGLADWMASDVGDVHEDDLEVYGGRVTGAAAVSTTRIASYSFEVTNASYEAD